MARNALEPTAKRSKRVNVSLTEELKEELTILAAIDRVQTTALAGKILSSYVATRQAEITQYREALAQIRKEGDSTDDKVAG